MNTTDRTVLEIWRRRLKALKSTPIETGPKSGEKRRNRQSQIALIESFIADLEQAIK